MSLPEPVRGLTPVISSPAGPLCHGQPMQHPSHRPIQPKPGEFGKHTKADIVEHSTPMSLADGMVLHVVVDVVSPFPPRPSGSGFPVPFVHPYLQGRCGRYRFMCGVIESLIYLLISCRGLPKERACDLLLAGLAI